MKCDHKPHTQRTCEKVLKLPVKSNDSEALLCDYLLGKTEKINRNPSAGRTWGKEGSLSQLLESSLATSIDFRNMCFGPLLESHGRDRKSSSVKISVQR